MIKDAWVLRLKDAPEHPERDTCYLAFSDEGTQWLTKDLGQAELFDDKEEQIESMKRHDQLMFDHFGKNAISNFGYKNIMANFDFVEVEVETED